MEVLETKLEKVLLFKPDIFEDFRGIYVETYNERDYSRIIKEKIGVDLKFVQDSMSRSFKNILRGVNVDYESWRLVDCPEGKIYLVIANCDEESKDFEKWQDFTLSESNMNQVLVPPKFGTLDLVLSEEAILRFKQSDYLNSRSLKPLDYKRFNIWLPIQDTILS